MSLKAARLQALFARRREAEQNRIERTEAVNKYFDHWGKVTARFEQWTAPDYYKVAKQQLQNSKSQKEKQKMLAERQEKLAQLFQMEKLIYDQEMQQKEKSKNSVRKLDTRTLEKINDKLKEEQQMRRKLEMEAKLYGKWRHGVDDDNLIFQSKSDNEVLAKLNWLDKQVDQQLQREKEQEIAKERELKMQQELNKTEELQKARQEIREKEIREMRCMQEHHLQQVKERQKETDDLKAKEKRMKDNLNDLKKELELLEECYNVLKQKAEFSDAFNLNKIKLFIRKRAEVFRNQINICISILQRTLDFAGKPEILTNFKKHLEEQLERENEKLANIGGMYESEAKYCLQLTEELWQREHTERYKGLKQILLDEYNSINASLSDVMKRQEELLEIRATHLNVIENSSEKLKILIQEEENSPRFQKTLDKQSQNKAKDAQTSSSHQAVNNIIHTQLEESANTPLYSPHRSTHGNTRSTASAVEAGHQVDFSARRNCNESNDNNLSPRCYNINRMSNTFNNLNLDVWQPDQDHPSERDLESQKTNSQRSLQVVTPETEAARPRFGRKRVAWN